jgi:cytochrome c oxidase cbb3-type subunit III
MQVTSGPLPVQRRPHFIFAILVLTLASAGIANSQAAVHAAAKQNSSAGKQAFASTCSGCHGLDGKGGERAPNIADRPNVQRLSDAQIAHIVENGIPGTGMPAFHTLTVPQIKSIVSYLRTLQGAKQQARLPGDPERGKTVFFSKAGCSGCHMVAGTGGFIASDLSDYTRTHDIDDTRSAIIDLATSRSGQVRLVTATTRNGDRLVGRVRNEDNFSLQLQTMDGTFHFLSKADIQGIESNPQSLMPSDYRSTLSAQELNDVIAYLMSMAGVDGTNKPKKRDEFED